jgi:hypothetical protein
MNSLSFSRIFPSLQRLVLQGSPSLNLEICLVFFSSERFDLARTDSIDFLRFLPFFKADLGFGKSFDKGLQLNLLERLGELRAWRELLVERSFNWKFWFEGLDFSLRDLGSLK